MTKRTTRMTRGERAVAQGDQAIMAQIFRLMGDGMMAILEHRQQRAHRVRYLLDRSRLYVGCAACGARERWEHKLNFYVDAAMARDAFWFLRWFLDEHAAHAAIPRETDLAGGRPGDP